MEVSYITHSGSDLLVCNSARVSFAKSANEEVSYFPDMEQAEAFSKEANGRVEYDYIQEDWIVTHLREKDRKLINFLARERHVLPFRHPQITLRCCAPISIARQLGKHQVGLSWSEESRRYIDSPPTFFYPESWRKRADNVKQGSSDEIITTMKFTNNVESWDGEVANFYQLHIEHSAQLYQSMLDSGVAPEQARFVLPQGMEVNWVWTGSLLSFFEMYKLRSEGSAQREAQHFARLVKDVIQPLYPVSWDALESAK